MLVNTLKGFDKIGQYYAINQNPLLYKYNWIQDDPYALIQVAVKKIPAVVGPNLFILPKNKPWGMPSLKYTIYLHPSFWCTTIWENFKECPVRVWPVGIDWEAFQVDKKKRKKNEMLLYFKKQPAILLEKAKHYLELAGYKVHVLVYGQYTEEEYKTVLEKSWFGVWIGTTESQGIGLQEALASDLPLIVLNNTDVRKIESQAVLDLPKYLSRYIGTSIPYWDNRCGIVINRIEDLPGALSDIVSRYDSFQPLEYIQENLGLEKCARRLLGYFDELYQNLSDQGGIPKTDNSRVAELRIYMIYKLFYLRSLVKRIYRKLYRIFKNY